MKCAFCGYKETKVTDKRDSEETTRRRRQCLSCIKRFTTYERPEVNIIIIKKDGRRERFDRQKLLSGVLKACEKRPVSQETIEKTINDVEAELRGYGAEIQSQTIGEILMEKLNGEIASIFRQTAFYNFETQLHGEFRKKGYLSKENIGELFKEHMSSYLGEFVDTSSSDNWWIYVPHFRYIFYVYSYVSGELISKSLQSKVKQNPKFIEKVKEFLSAGTSDSPKNIFLNLGIDISKKDFWLQGLNEIESLLNETENLARKLKKI